jgi:4-amino-4-deoxy-L-arabinose transferase-like glycosyltransferase
MFSDQTDRKLGSIVRSPALAVVAAYGLRMLLFWLSHHYEDFTHPKYETVGMENNLVALSLATGKGFFGPYPGYDAITAVIAPVYPFLSAIGYKLFHLDSFAGVIFCQTMNCAFSAATCWPIYGVGNKLFGEKMGLASAWLWVFLPYAVLYPLEWTWDQSLAALMLALIMWATFGLRDSVSRLQWSGYGLLWGFTALVNPTICILLPFLLAWIVFRRSRAEQPSARLVARTVVLFILTLLPWTIRNYYAVDGFVFVKSNFGLEFWLGNNPAVKQVVSPDLHPMSSYAERVQLILNGEPNYNHMKQKQAMAYILSHPRTFLKNLFDRVVDNWAATYDSKVDPWIPMLHLSKADVWFCSAFSVLSFAGMILALRGNFLDSLPLAMSLLLFPVPYYITHTGLRYRHPIDPFMAIFTVYALFGFLSAVRRQRTLGGSETIARTPIPSASGTVRGVTDRLARLPLQR